MIGNAFLWVTLCWLPILLYIMLRNEVKFKKNIAIGVTFPLEGRKHPNVLDRLEKFKKQEMIVCIVLTLLCVPGFFLKFSLSVTLWFIWMLLCIVVPYIPYVQCNSDLKRIKTENGWKQPAAADTVTVDLSALPEANWISPWTFVPALLLSPLPMVFDRDFAVMYLIDTALIVFCWFGYRYLYRNKAETVDSNTTVTIALTRIRRNQWGKMWLLCAYSIALINWVALLTKYSPTAMTVGLVIFMAVLLGASMHIEFQTRRLQETLTADSGRDFYVDDDDKWLGGLIYYNPNDSRTIINNRVGTNSSVNLAKPAGKIMYGFVALMLVTLPLWGVLLGDGDITASIGEETLHIKGGMHEYTIEAADVIDIELLEELPVMTRTAGSGMPEFLGGDFSSREYGRLKVCLNPTAPPFLLVETAEQSYLLGTNDEALTQEIFNNLSD